ncbi:MAG: retropepsin-like aspartic protease [Flavipsychrobacter sp.]
MTAALRTTLISVLIVALFSLNAFAEKVASINFQYSESLIFVRVKVNNKTGLLFLMDTGANTSVLDKNAATLLKMPVLEHDTVIGTAGKEPVDYLKVKSISVANVSLSNMRITRRDLSKFISLNGKQIDGVLGMDFLKHFAVIIDFRTKKIAFSKRSINAGKYATIPFELHDDNTPMFEARFNDTFSTYLHYNSGVSIDPSKDVYVNVAPSQWYELKRINRQLAPQKYLTGKGVGGNVYLQVIKIERLNFRNLLIKDPLMIVQPEEGYFQEKNAIGFFGNNLFEKCHKVTIDFINKQVIINTIKKTGKLQAIAKK